jgi:hypothetical protein
MADTLSEGMDSTPATAPDTAGLGSGNADNTAGNTTAEAIWERNFAEQPPPAEAAPPSDASPESAAPKTETPQPDPDADEYDKIDPNNAKAQDFQSLRGRKKELERKLKLVEPLAQKAQAFGDPGVLDIVAPLFQNFENDDDPALYQAGSSTVQSLLAYDPRVANGLAVGVYEHYKDWIHEEALKEQGITPQDLASFKEWKQTGGGVRTVYAPQGFPEADREGYVTLPNGVELNVGKADDPTSGDPTHKAMYELAKDNWETKEREKQREAETHRQAAEYQQQQQAAIISQRQATWSNAELTAFEQFVNANPIKVDEHQEQAELMTMGVLQHLISEDSELAQWVDEGKRLAGQGAIKANALAMNARQRSQDHYTKARDTVTGIFTELTNLRKIVSGGRVQNAPRLPSDSIPDTQPGQQTPPPPSQAGDAYRDIWTRNLP